MLGKASNNKNSSILQPVTKGNSELLFSTCLQAETGQLPASNALIWISSLRRLNGLNGKFFDAVIQNSSGMLALCSCIFMPFIFPVHFPNAFAQNIHFDLSKVRQAILR